MRCSDVIRRCSRIEYCEVTFRRQVSPWQCHASSQQDSGEMSGLEALYTGGGKWKARAKSDMDPWYD